MKPGSLFREPARVLWFNISRSQQFRFSEKLRKRIVSLYGSISRVCDQWKNPEFSGDKGCGFTTVHWPKIALLLFRTWVATIRLSVLPCVVPTAALPAGVPL